MLSEIMCRRIFQQQKQQDNREARLSRRGWAKGCSGRLQGRSKGAWGRPRARPPHWHPQRPLRPLASLRPVNVKGNRARGMRAPQNTNQFLMREKYRMLHLRSDSVGSDCGCSSDSDPELTDMDSYLGVLENARGGLLDSPDPHGSTLPPPRPVLDGDGPGVFLQEDSEQYFPSEDDLLQSQNFMQRDFAQFCDFLWP